MSKQADEVGQYLKLIFPDTESERVFGKIVGNKRFHSIRVDYYIPSINCIVEVHGIQHFKPSGFGRSKTATAQAHRDQVSRDDRLIQLCNQYGVNYEQINYDDKIDYAFMFRKFEKYLDEEEQ